MFLIFLVVVGEVMKTIYVVGAGRMGLAVMQGLRGRACDFFVKAVEVDDKKIEVVKGEGFVALSTIGDLCQDDLIILAVPPQQLESVLIDHKALVSHVGLIISVMAGVTCTTLHRYFCSASIVRSIPNLASEVGQGVTLYYAGNDIDPVQLNIADSIFEMLGLSFRVDAEVQLDSGTALVGGGPALIDYFCNGLKLYALREGFEVEFAGALVRQLLYGTAILVNRTCKETLKICSEVQTKGGTTECAISVFEKYALNDLITKSLTAAAARSVELGSKETDRGLRSLKSYYEVYFGLGHLIRVRDNPEVFRVSRAGVVFGALLLRLFSDCASEVRYLDVGTGSGIHAMLLRSLGAKYIVATDVSRVSIATAVSNEIDNFGFSAIEFIAGSLFGLKVGLSNKYDVVIFNPPGWRSPSDVLLSELKRVGKGKKLPVESMFYGDTTLKEFFLDLPRYLLCGGRAIVGFNSLVGVKQVIDDFYAAHQRNYVITHKLLESHEFPLMLYTEAWLEVKDAIQNEIIDWVHKGYSNCRILDDGQIIWLYEIVEFTLWEKGDGRQL